MASRKGSLRNAGNEDGSWNCKLCNKTFTDKKAELMECEYCDEHFCSKCLNLSAAEYKLLSKRSDLHWYCPPCEEKAMKNLKIEKEIEDRCKEYFSKYEKRIDTLEQEVKKKADIPKVKELIEESLSGKEKDGAERQNHISEDIKEFRESEARRNNIIIFNVNESKSTVAEARKKEDTEYVQDLSSILEANPWSVKTVARLGKVKRENENVSTTNRPMKVVFDDEKSKSVFMSNVRKLRTAEEKFKSISIVHDMTIREREINKEKVKQAKEKNDENKSGDYQYAVRGPPWERKVVKVKVKK